MSQVNILHCKLYTMQHIIEYEMSELNVTQTTAAISCIFY